MKHAKGLAAGLTLLFFFLSLFGKFSSVYAADSPVRVVVKTDYSTPLGAQLSDTLVELVDNNPMARLVMKAHGYHLKFELTNVEPTADKNGITVNLQSMLYARSPKSRNYANHLIHTSQGFCNRRLLYVCQSILIARFNQAVDVAVANRGMETR